MHTIRRCRTTSEHPPERDVCGDVTAGWVLTGSRLAFSRLHSLSLFTGVNTVWDTLELHNVISEM